MTIYNKFSLNVCFFLKFFCWKSEIFNSTQKLNSSDKVAEVEPSKQPEVHVRQD